MTQNLFDSKGASAQTPEFISLQIPDLNPQPDASVESPLTPDPSPPNANSDFSKKIRPSEAVLIVVGILIAVTRLTLTLWLISINDNRSFDWYQDTLKRVGCPALHMIGFCLLGLRHYVKQLGKRTSRIVKAIKYGVTFWSFVMAVSELAVYIYQQNQLGLEFGLLVTYNALLLPHVILVALVSKVI